MAPRNRTQRDPYYRCELYCNHDLGLGMSVAELLDENGPRPITDTAPSSSPTVQVVSAAVKARIPILRPAPVDS